MLRVSRSRQLDREIAQALRQRRHHSTAQDPATFAASATPDDLYMVAYDVLRLFEPYKKLKQEKIPEAQELLKRFHAIRKEIRAKFPNAEPPDQYTKLYEKLTKPDKTYPQAQRDILDDLQRNGWQVSAGLKIPHATSPNGRLRLWFKPQAVWFTKVSPGERHDFKNARTVSYDLDIRTKDPADFRDWMTRSSEK